MKQTHISFILDKSSSMQSVKEATISGFNEYVATLQQDKEVEYTFDLTFFDTVVTKAAVNKPLNSLEPLTATSYNPNGNTALYDGVCETLLAREGKEGGKWIVVIMTDGEENSSRKYSKEQFKDYVKLLQATGVVTFVFMGANQDAWLTAKQFGFHQGNTVNYMSTEAGVRGMFAANAKATSTLANSAGFTTQAFFEKPQDDAEANKAN